MDKCVDHANGKTCTQVIAEGKCYGKKCRLFPRVVRIIPKLKKMREAQAKGIILHTIWNFSENAKKRREKKKEKAKKWLEDFYPKIKQNLAKLGVEL